MHEAAIAEIADKYQSKGYSVKKDVRVGDMSIDLIVDNGERKIYFEFKVSKNQETRPETKQQAERDNAEFRLVYVTPPLPVTISIEAIEHKIKSHLEMDMPSEVDELSTHSSIEDVSDVEIESINVQPNKIVANGSFSLTVGLQYGSSSDVREDIGYETEAAFNAEFKAEFDGHLTITSLDVDIDMSDWYE